MGFVDRGGGREAKGTSLRRSKKNPGAPTTKNKSAHKNYITPTTRATPTPPTAAVAAIKKLAEVEFLTGADGSAATRQFVEIYQRVCASAKSGAALHVDAAIALLSRKLEDDQEGIFRRAVEEGKLAGAICWSNEVEKQATLLDTCVQHNKLYRGADGASAKAVSSSSATGSGAEGKAATPPPPRHVRFQDPVATHASPVAITAGSPLASSSAKSGVILYAVLGVHVNSIDRVNMRLHEQWMKELEENVKHGDVVGVLSGLNLSRDHGTHYAQERLMRECWRVAADAGLPLVLHLYAADAATLSETVNRAAELLTELLNGATSDKDANNNNNNGNNKSAPSAVVLYNGLSALHASPAMQQLVRTHRPCIGRRAASTAISAHAGATDAAAVSCVTDVPFYVLATAEGLAERAAGSTTGEEESADGKAFASASVEQLSALLPALELSTVHVRDTPTTTSDEHVLALSQLLIGTGAPFSTPQNLPDPYLCSLPNEPGNYPYVVQTLFDAMTTAEQTKRKQKTTNAPAAATPSDSVITVTSAQELAAVAYLNHLTAFFHECVDEEVERRKAAESEGEKAHVPTQQGEHNNNKNNNNKRREEGGENDSSDDDDDAGVEDSDSDAARQRAWAASQKPAAATVVAGLTDAKAKQDLETLLAEAAKERERVEAERLREEAAREQARNDELLEKRNKRERKKNVKANNRSNFTHFRNKDFAPRQSKQERLAHQRALEGHEGADVSNSNSDEEESDEEAAGEVVENTHDAAQRLSSKNKSQQQQQQRKNARGGRHAPASESESEDNKSSDCSSSSDDDEDNKSEEAAAPAAGSLAAEVELLLREVEEEKKAGGGKGGKKNNKNNNKKAGNKLQATPSATPPPAASANSKKNQGKKGTNNKHKNRRAGSDSESEEEEDRKGRKGQSDSDEEDAMRASSGGDDVDGAQKMLTAQQTRRQRKRQQKRQQHAKGDDSNEG